MYRPSFLPILPGREGGFLCRAEECLRCTGRCCWGLRRWSAGYTGSARTRTTPYGRRRRAKRFSACLRRGGNFYDCDGLPLTGLSEQWLALCFPGEGSYARLYPYADADGQAVLYRERNASRPFLLEVAQDVRGLGVRCYAVPRRYAAAPLAEHLIGYLDGEGRGAAGLEAALDDILSTGGQDILRCAVTAQGRLRRGSEPVLEKASAVARGVRLTLSRSIQRAAEGVAAESMAAGCILILEAGSGKVRACVSRPASTRPMWARA